ncbi:DUF1622 domain-containing protein [Methanomicrobium antiquum]|uniref:DUF1622 domain-containing protein n=1 Tax=Methanomicrobium antiquum TaxID=487686 RepID=A0AAF0FSD6_9EURY|nr:DUF1622 domain-containing protein [Methanomicrobium antiquum]MDD3977686.1 DUF1622 domain-containing protein [Methanomicrobium sp.]WFN37727.1 DUF1622 domain-containing protein [Methanomicrobium antiquum]
MTADLIPVSNAIQLVVLFFEIAGAAIIVYGGGIATFRIVLRELNKTNLTYGKIRIDLTTKIVLGLEFLIISDILMTVISPTQDELIILAVTVLIRTILGYFLEREAVMFNIDS